MKNTKTFIIKVRNFILGILTLPVLSVAYSLRKGMIFAEQNNSFVKKDIKSGLDKKLVKIQNKQKKLYEAEQELKGDK